MVSAIYQDFRQNLNQRGCLTERQPPDDASDTGLIDRKCVPDDDWCLLQKINGESGRILF